MNPPSTSTQTKVQLSLGLHALNQPTQAWYWAIRATTGFLTVVNNILVLVAISMRRTLRRRKSNWFVLSLSIADLLVGVVITSIQIYEAVKKSTNPELRFIVNDFLIDASILSLCTLTLDRYKAIVSPLRYINYMTQFRAMTLIVVSWGVPFMLALLRIIMIFTGIKDEKEREKMFLVIQTLFFVILPCLTLSGSYIRILLIVRRHNRNEKRIKAQVDYNYSTDSTFQSTDDDYRPNDVIRTGLRRLALEDIQEDEVSESTAARIFSGILSPKHDKSSLAAIGVVIILYDCCWGFAIYSYILESFLELSVRQDLKHIMWLLVLINSALNPLVYAILKRDIRRAISDLLLCCKAADSETTTGGQEINIEISQPPAELSVMTTHTQL